MKIIKLILFLTVLFVSGSCQKKSNETDDLFSGVGYSLPPYVSVTDIDVTKTIKAGRLSNMSVSDLWLLRNEIFAIHGYPFSTFELFAFFMSKDWYLPLEDFDMSSMTDIELENIDVLKEAEDALAAQSYQDENGDKRLNYDCIYNSFQFGDFTDEQIELIEKNGFVAIPCDYLQLYNTYENNHYACIPSYVTTDVFLQLYYLLFLESLKYIEQEYLLDNLIILSESLLDSLSDLSLSGLDSAITKSEIFLSVPLEILLTNEFTPAVSVAGAVGREVEKIEDGSGYQKNELTKEMYDYSQFIVRGHYNESEDLKQYFKAMMWFGTLAFSTTNDVALQSSFLMTEILYESDYKDLYDEIVSMSGFFAGEPDGLNLDDYHAVYDNVFESLSDLNDSDKLNEAKVLLEALSEDKLKIVQYSFGEQGAEFRFMGQRYAPDSEVIQALIEFNVRDFPNGLDVMAAFGNERAKNLMLNDLSYTWENLPDYPARLSTMTEKMSSVSESEWTSNFYMNWLYSLFTLWEDCDTTDDYYLSTDAWQDRILNTSLSSWAELRHNTILYTKQGVCAECAEGGEMIRKWYPEPPKGYVEPNPEFFGRMAEFLEMTRDTLESVGVDNLYSTYTSMIENVEILEAIAEKEIAGDELTIEEYEYIQSIGAEVENITFNIMKLPGSSRFLPENRKDISVIADVSSTENQCLEVGIGRPLQIFVALEIDGKLKLARGSIFHYYEFTWPSSDRLTDEFWQTMLTAQREPDDPEWLDSFLDGDAEKHSLNSPIYISDYATSEEGYGWQDIYSSDYEECQRYLGEDWEGFMY